MKTKWLKILIVFLLIFSVFFIINQKKSHEEVGQFEEAEEINRTYYENSMIGISFSYPEDYLLRESEILQENGKKLSVSLVSKNNGAPAENSELPNGLKIEVFENEENLSLQDWLESESNFEFSNYNLKTNQAEGVQVAGDDGLGYLWSGLYEVKTVAFMHNQKIILLSVEYISPEDQILSVFEQILSTLSLKDSVIPERI